MGYRIKNPAWKSQVQQKAEACAPAVAAFLAANPGIETVTLAELRAGLPGIAADLSRRVVNQIVDILGLTVEGADDQGG